MNIATLTEDQILTLAEGLTRADLESRSVRIVTGVDGHGPYIMWSIGQGMWTLPQHNAETWKN